MKYLNAMIMSLKWWLMMSDKFVVSTNEIGEIIVTDTETGNVYHYGSMSNFLGLIRLMNEQQATIDEQKEAIDYLKTVIRYTIPNQMVADVFKRIGEEYE